ncbi:MAG TPA: hypothetical protein VF507_05390, partial [Pyrinomonadaceae bacterium]
GDHRSTTKDSNAGGECLLCRLHQHLFGGLIAEPARVCAATALHVPAELAAINHLSQANAPRHGRGPPLS